MLCNCSLLNFNGNNVILTTIVVLTVSLQVVMLTFDKINPVRDSLSIIVKIFIVISFISSWIDTKKLCGIRYHIWSFTKFKSAPVITSHVESVFSCHLSHKPPSELLRNEVIVFSVRFHVCVKLLILRRVFSFISPCSVIDLSPISFSCACCWVFRHSEIPQFSSDTILTNKWNINNGDSGFGSNCAVEFTFTELGDSACNSINLDIDAFVVKAKSFDLDALTTCQVTWFLTDVENDWDGLCFVALSVVCNAGFHVEVMFNSQTGFPKHGYFTLKSNWLVTNNTSKLVSFPSMHRCIGVNISFKINEGIANFCVDERHLVTG